MVPARGWPNGRGVEVHLSAEVGGADGERSGRGLEVSSGSGEDAKRICEPDRDAR